MLVCWMIAAMLRLALLLLSFIQFVPAPGLGAVDSPAAGYPDSTSGLERLAKDIVNAQLQSDSSRVDSLLQSLTLPEAFDWYQRVFDREAAEGAGSYYQKEATSIRKILMDTFVKASQAKNVQIRAVRFEQSCDDSASEGAYGILIRRQQSVPIYELRFFSGDRVTRLFPLAYVDGAFRFFLFPDFRPRFSKPDGDARHEASSGSRITVDRSMQPPVLVHRVDPTYPAKTRLENASGAVKIHLVIDKQGQVSTILGAHGVCSMAESAVRAVRQWRYEPYRVDGTPVEVDTEVVILYSLFHQPYAGVENQ